VREPVVRAGRRYLSLELVAEVYQVQSVVLHACYERGLLGKGVVEGSAVCIATVQLDRVATIHRLHEVHGLDVDRIAAWLDAR